MSIEACRMSMRELHEKARSIDPKRMSDLQDMWESSDMSNEWLVQRM